jgi:flagellar biosynthesis protein FliP
VDAELSGEGLRLGVWAIVLGLPLVLTLATAFTKSTVVLGALRLGLSAEALLPAPVILSLALVVTAIVMAPTAAATMDAVEVAGGLEALVQGARADWRPVAAPLLDFVARHADPAEVEFFAQLGGRAATDPTVIVPAFLATELTEALAMAVVILLPFVVVDLLAAQALGLAGVQPPSSQLVTVPLKILLFLAVGGWDVVIGGLAQGYA